MVSVGPILHLSGIKVYGYVVCIIHTHTNTNLHVPFQFFFYNNKAMLILNIFIPAKKSKLTLKYTSKYVCTFIREKIFVISANCHK